MKYPLLAMCQLGYYRGMIHRHSQARAEEFTGLVRSIAGVSEAFASCIFLTKCSTQCERRRGGVEKVTHVEAKSRFVMVTNNATY